MYRWKPGARCKADVNVVGEILETMAAEDRLTAANLVEDSRPEEAPLHNEFTWDDTKAAESWRRQEAMMIINSVEIRIENHEPVQAFVKISSAERNYLQTSVLIRAKETRDILLENALRELQGIQRKYAAIAELADVFREIEKLGA